MSGPTGNVLHTGKLDKHAQCDCEAWTYGYLDERVEVGVKRFQGCFGSPWENFVSRFLPSPIKVGVSMRIDLNCPFAEKDQAKALGARWDAGKRVWYIVDVEDLTPFMRWMPRATADEEPKTITLAEYQSIRYAGTCHALSHKAARAFGIPYPLESGWFKKYKHRTAQVSVLDDKPVKGRKQKSPKTDYHATVTTGTCTPLCDCDVLPWEDCEHTEALAQQAMHEMLA
jgi:hypothetical protein